MLDDFENDINPDEFLNNLEAYQEAPEQAMPTPPSRGMTAIQRFIIALMVLFIVCILGSFFLLITGRIAPPFL